MKALPVELLAPSQRSDIAILVHGLIRDKMQLLANGGAGVGIGAVIQQQAGEGVRTCKPWMAAYADFFSDDWTSEPVRPCSCRA